MLNGNAGGAEESVRLLAANFPDQPAVQAQLGRLLLMKDDPAGARRAFERALSKDGAQPEALEGITVLDIRQGRSAAARARLDAAVAAGPNNAMLQLAAAHLYSEAFKDEAAAERAARRAVTIDPNNLEAFGTLARLHAQANNLQAATAEFEKLAERQPRSVANQTAVGMLLHLQNRLDDAKARYERALAIDPHSPVAANNLAQLYADRNENLDVALQLAQTAKAGLPNAHQVDDTLGWIYYKKGVGELAVASLKRAVAAQPDNVVYLYHLGAAHALAGDKVNARLMLDKALRLQPNFAGADDARRILDSLKN
jgi:Flp pilus assembly protein TadD